MFTRTFFAIRPVALLASALSFATQGFAIVGGGPLPPGHPGLRSAVGLQLRTGRVERISMSICSGTLIRADVVLTAAHCLANVNVENVVFGEQMFSPVGATARKVLAATFHPAYFKDGKGFNFDLGLVRFAGPLPPEYAPSRVLTDRRALQAQLPLELVGYGDDITGIGRAGRRLGTPSFLGSFIPEATVSLQPIGAPRSPLELFLRSILIVGPLSGHGACQGDSGGPAYTRLGNEWLLAGVLKGSIDDLCESGRTMYTFAGDSVRWIQDVLARWR